MRDAGGARNENRNERRARATSKRREDADAPLMALRAETALAAGATRAMRAELAMADMVRIDAEVRATRYTAIPRGRLLQALPAHERNAPRRFFIGRERPRARM